MVRHQNTQEILEPRHSDLATSQATAFSHSNLTAALHNSGTADGLGGEAYTNGHFDDLMGWGGIGRLVDQAVGLQAVERNDLNTGHTHGALSRAWQLATDDELQSALSDKDVEPWTQYQFGATSMPMPIQTLSPTPFTNNPSSWHSAGDDAINFEVVPTELRGHQPSGQRNQAAVGDPTPAHLELPNIELGSRHSSGSRQSFGLTHQNANFPSFTTSQRDNQALVHSACPQQIVDLQPLPADVTSVDHSGLHASQPLAPNQYLEDDAVQEDDDWFVGAMEGIDFDDQMNFSYQSRPAVLSDPFDSESLTGRQSQPQSFANSYESGRHIKVSQFSQHEFSADDQPQYQSSAQFGDLLDPSQHHLNPDHHFDTSIAAEAPLSSNRFQDGVSASFPTTAHFYPPTLEETASQPAPAPVLHSIPTPKSRPRGLTIPSNFPRTSSVKLPDRTNPRARKSRANSISAISEKGNKALSPTGVQKGRRHGPLQHASAAAAAQKRKNKSTCIRCRYHKVNCPGKAIDSPCEQCMKPRTAAKTWDGPCLSGHFLDKIEEDTCNYIFQSFCCHTTLDGLSRVMIHYRLDFELPWMVARLQQDHVRFNIEVRSFLGTRYTIDLAKILGHLRRVYNTPNLGPWYLRDIIDSKKISLSRWLECLIDLDPHEGMLERYIKYNNMPSRNTYSIVSTDSLGPSRPLDVTNPDDKAIIILAVQLCRITLRALEITAFKDLQKEVGEISKSRKPRAETEKAAAQLGRILLSLRWRLAWWQLMENGSNGYLDVQDAVIARTTTLAQTLYFWYCAFMKKLQTTAVDGQSRSGGQRSEYADAEPFWEDFPTVDTAEGFQQWLGEGPSLVWASQQRLDQTHAVYG